MVDLELIRVAAAHSRWEEVLGLTGDAEPSDDIDASRVTRLRAMALRFLGRGAEAEAAARRALELAPAGQLVQLEALTELAQCSRSSREALYERAIALADGLDAPQRAATLRIELARERLSRGDARTADRLLDEAAGLHPAVEERAPYLLTRARVASRLGNGDQHAWLLRAVATKEPLDRARGLGDLAMWHHARGEVEQAIALLRQGLEEIGKVGGRTHTEAQLTSMLGDSLRVAGDLEGAEDCYERAGELLAARRSPEEAVSRCNLGILKLERGDVAGAREMFDALDRASTTHNALLHVAVGLGLSACAAETRDRALWRRAFAPWAAGVERGMALDPDFVMLAERAARLAGRVGWRDQGRPGGVGPHAHRRAHAHAGATAASPRRSRRRHTVGAVLPVSLLGSGLLRRGVAGPPPRRHRGGHQGAGR